MHNCVFVGYGTNKLPAYATVRGTLTEVQYRKDSPGSDKSISFCYGKGQYNGRCI